jgi:hypothetical protein
MSPVTLSTTKWTAIGPAPIESGGGLGAISGRIEAAAPDLVDPSVLYVAGNNGGIWKNIKPPGWVPLTDFMPSLSFGGYHSLVVHPANHDIVLGVVSGPGAGLLKSVNAGGAWQLLANSQFDQQGLGSIAVHPTNTDLMYISAGWFGAWKSTDGGSTWTQLSSLPGGNVTDLIVAKFNSNYLYAGVVGNSGASQAQNGVYRSTDGGSTWDLLTGLPSGASIGSQYASGAVRLDSGKGTGVVYVSILTLGPPTPPQAVTAVQRFKSTDGGTTWTALSPTLGTLEARSWHLLIAVTPEDDNHIFANDAYFLNESTDGGSTWTQADAGIGWLPGINHFDWVNMAFDANGNAIATADQGVFRYHLKNQKWTNLVANLEVSELYTIALDPKDSQVAYAIGQDLFSEKFAGNTHWKTMQKSIGETGRFLIDHHNPSQICAFNPLDTNNFVRQSLNAGATWTTIFPASLLSPSFLTAYSAQGGGYTFAYGAQKAFVMDQSNPARVCAVADRVFESTNVFSPAPTWTAISGVLSKDASRPFIFALAMAPSDGNTLYAATQDDHLWVTYDNGAHWKEFDTGLSGRVLVMCVDPADKNHVFAVSGGDVWEVTSAGLPWAKITGNLPAGYLGLNTIFVDWHAAVPRLFVGTSRGLYQSADLGHTWTKFDPGLPNTSVNDLQGQFIDHHSGRKLLLAAATYGRGAWEILVRPWGAVVTAIADSGNFGQVCKGSFHDELLTINNNGTGSLLVTKITSSSPDFLVPSVVSYPILLRSGGSIDLAIRFQPTKIGSVAATITIDSDDPDGPHKVSVSGDCPAPRLSLMLANKGNFGKVCIGSFVDEPLILNNNGKCTLTLTGIGSSSGEFVAPEILSGPQAIAPGAFLPAPIRFQPTSFGSKSAVLTVNTNDPAGPRTINVSGEAPSGTLAVTGSTCLGGVKDGCCAERTISICNVGECSLHVTSVAFKKKSCHWKLANNPFPAALHPGSCLGVVIRYKAGERCPRACELVISSDDPHTPVKILDVTAYTIWNDCCKPDCDCHKKHCEKPSIECCCDESYDDDEDKS